MKCPHCGVAFHENAQLVHLGEDVEGRWDIEMRNCPECKKAIIHLRHQSVVGMKMALPLGLSSRLIRPHAVSRPVPPEVPTELAADHVEACAVLPISPKASAALSRRCLQHLLREHAGVKPSTLAKEIQQVIDSGKLPSHLADAIDAVRNIGNFAAHPNKSEKTGEIFDVEPGEAEWNLDVLDGLFDFYFVQPAILKKKRDDLNKKLKEAGKPPMK